MGTTSGARKWKSKQRTEWNGEGVTRYCKLRAISSGLMTFGGGVGMLGGGRVVGAPKSGVTEWSGETGNGG